jgi:ubiquinone/menaquinone biosynthesis C-methylase UbiE
MAETSKAHQRRLKAGWFKKYIKGDIIDIGVGRIDTHDGADIVHPDAVAHDKDICDAHEMIVYPDNSFDCVHASHIIEHLNDPVTAVINWFRILKPGGHLIISAPHRDLYERRKTLPSNWNLDHKFFILPNECEPPHTFSLSGIIHQALKGLPYSIVYFDVANTTTNTDKPDEHANGEFSIEAIIKKNETSNYTNPVVNRVQKGNTIENRGH